MRITDIIGCMVWVSALLAVIAVVPVLGLFIGLLTPIVFTYYLHGRAPRDALQFLAIVVGTIVLVSAVAGMVTLGVFCLEFAALGYALVYAYQRRLSIGWTMGLGTASLLCGSLMAVLVVAVCQGTGPTEIIRSYLNANLMLSPEAYKSMGLPPEKAAELNNYTSAVRNALLRIYPSLMVVGSSFVVWVNLMMGKRLFYSKGIQVFEKRDLLMWKAPEHLVWGVIVSGFSLFLPFEGIRFVMLNLLIIFMAVYLFQGMAIFSYFLDRFRVPSWARIALYLFIVVQQFFLVLLALGGLFDQWINFRRAGINES